MRSISAEWASTSPAVVVFALGTNDAWSADLSLDAALSAMDEMIARFPDACLAGVEVNEISTATGYQQAEAIAINEAMRQELDVTAAWVTPEGLRSDGIHANLAGRLDFAEAVLDGIMRCAA
jgi:lysophospholipase L1-like esterase